MYQRIITCLEGDYRFNEKNSKKNIIDDSLMLHHYNDVIDIMKQYIQDINTDNYIDSNKSSYNINEDNIIESYVEIYKKICFDYNEHYKIEFKYIEDDIDMMHKTNQLIDFLQNICDKNKVTISVTRRGFDDNLNNLQKNMQTYPIRILLTKTMKRIVNNNTRYITSNIYTITLYKMEDTMCICLENYFGKRIPLVKDEVISPNFTWYSKYPSKYTNYIYSQANLDKIMNIITGKNSRLYKDELIINI